MELLWVPGWWSVGVVVVFVLLGKEFFWLGLLALVFFFFAPFVHLLILDRAKNAEWERRMRTVEMTDVDEMSGRDFEIYVARLLKNEGFKTKHLGGPRDFGADILAQREGVKYAVQVKRSSSNISRRAVSDAVAAKSHFKCKKALVVTNSFLSAPAKNFAKSTDCDVIDRYKLADLIDRYS
jgi:HJR/Mrr/RecB family endonuclease